MAMSALVTLNGFTGPNPGLGPGTVGVTCSLAVFNEDGSLYLAFGPALMCNVSAGAAWADIQAALVTGLQADFDPALTVTFFPG
jgi:hypothetical protein